MSRAILILAAALLLAVPFDTQAQQAPAPAEKPKAYASYDDLFDDFSKRREVLLTRHERLREKERIEPAELQAIEDELRALDAEYVTMLRAYIDANPQAKDLMPARFEVAVTLSRLDDRLDEAVTAADAFLDKHSDSELAADARFLKAQTLFRITGRETACVEALEDFIARHPDRNEAPAARMMRVRALLFLNRVDDARRSLRLILSSKEVQDDKDAKEFLQGQLDSLDWIGRDLPDFSVALVGGERTSRADFVGKPMLLVVYDSTSQACLGELPFIEEAARRFNGKLNVLGVSVNESKAAFEQWLDRNKERIAFKNTWIDREAENTLVKKLNVSLIPFNVLVDDTGKVYRYDVRSDDMLRYAELLAK